MIKDKNMVTIFLRNTTLGGTKYEITQTNDGSVFSIRNSRGMCH